MKYRYGIILIFFFLLNEVNAQKQYAGNPVLKGWYADPEAVVFGKQYWIYPTYSDKYNKQVFFDAFSSTDLVHWEKHEHILDTSVVRWAKRAMWAPAVVKKDDKFYFFFSANDIQNNQEYGGIGVAVADKPEGPYTDLLGKPLISQFYNGAQPIDQFVFKDQDGKYYIIYGGWGHCNIAQLNDTFTGFVPDSAGIVFKEITPGGYVEGPFMFVRNNKYYFMWSEGGWTGPDYSVAYAIADNPFGPYQRIGRILEQDSLVARGSGHHSIIHNAKKDSWYIVYHRRPLNETAANNRATCIDRMYFDKEGKILPVKQTFRGVRRQRL